jgi:hypothetical protein
MLASLTRLRQGCQISSWCGIGIRCAASDTRPVRPASDPGHRLASTPPRANPGEAVPGSHPAAGTLPGPQHRAIAVPQPPVRQRIGIHTAACIGAHTSLVLARVPEVTNRGGRSCEELAGPSNAEHRRPRISPAADRACGVSTGVRTRRSGTPASLSTMPPRGDLSRAGRGGADHSGGSASSLRPPRADPAPQRQVISSW